MTAAHMTHIPATYDDWYAVVDDFACGAALVATPAAGGAIPVRPVRPAGPSHTRTAVEALAAYRRRWTTVARYLMRSGAVAAGVLGMIADADAAGGAAVVSDMAETLGVSPGRVRGMVRALGSLGVVTSCPVCRPGCSGRPPLGVLVVEPDYLAELRAILGDPGRVAGSAAEVVPPGRFSAGDAGASAEESK